MKSLRTTLLAATLSVLTACMGPATGPTNKGDALFTVKGQLALNGTSAPTAPIRLAVAWYPDDQTTSAPRALVTQDVQYQGSFPLNYSFSFFTVPPASVLTDYTSNGVTTRAAYGVLMAYEDVNGNGQLDSIAAGGSAIDHVLGTSLGDVYNGNPVSAPVYVAYVDGQPPSDWAGYTAGFNLLQGGQVVPANTAVAIPLDQTNELNFFVCEEFVSGTSKSFDLPCNIAPTGGVRAVGNLFQADGVGGLSLRVTDGTNAITTAQVEVNGAAVAYSAADGLYYGTGLQLNVPGQNQVKVTVAGQAPRVFSLESTGDFTFPAVPQRIEAGTALNLSWQKAPGAFFYVADAYRSTPPYDSVSAPYFYEDGSTTKSVSLAGLTADDTYTVEVLAFARNYLARGLGGSSISSSVLHQQLVDVIPANAGLRLEGTVTLLTSGGQTSGSVWVDAFDGVTELSQASVTANGQALTYDQTYKLFGLDSAQLVAGQSASLSVSGNGKAAVSVQVPLAGDFTVQAPAPSQSKSQPIALSWTASAGASDYRVWVTDSTGAYLHFERTNATSETIPALNVSGDVYVNVAAAKTSGDRHLIGLVQKNFTVTLTP